MVLVAAVARGQRKTAVPSKPDADPFADPSPVLPSGPKTVLPPNPDTFAQQQEPLKKLQQKVLDVYEEVHDWFHKLTAAERRKCKQKQGFRWHGHALVFPNSQNLKKCLHKLHECPHSGIAKTQKAMNRLYWPQLPPMSVQFSKSLPDSVTP